MNLQIALLEQASELLNVAQEAQVVLRYLEIKRPQPDGIYEWIKSACWSRFEAESEVLADQYRDVLDAPESDEANNA